MFNITGSLGTGYWCTCGAYVHPGVVHQCGTYTIPVFPPPQPPVHYQWPPAPPITAEQATKMLDRLEAIEKKLEEMDKPLAFRLREASAPKKALPRDPLEELWDNPSDEEASKKPGS